MIKAVILIIAYLILYYLVGFAVVRGIGGDEKKDSVMLNGMFGYALLFFVVGLPMKLAKVTLTKIGVVWLICLAAAIAVCMWKWHEDILEDWKRKLHDISSHKWIALGVAIVVILELVWVEMQNVPGSPMDTAYYVGEVSTAVYDNAAGITEVHSGTPLSSFSHLYTMETYLLHSSVVCRIFHVAPLIEVRTVMSAVVIIMFNIIMWQIGKHLFRDCRWKMLLLLAAVFVFCMFCNSYYMPGSFLLRRTYEGKNILSNIFVPAVFLYFLQLLEEDRRSSWIGMFLAICVSYTYCMSATFVAPVYLLGICGALVLYKRKWKTVWNSLICMLPAGAMVVLYFCMSKGYIVFRI